MAHYRTENGTVHIEGHLEELEHLHDWIELGPHWDTIEIIEVFRINHCTDEKLTMEGALKLSADGGEKAQSIAVVHGLFFRSHD